VVSFDPKNGPDEDAGDLLTGQSGLLRIAFVTLPQAREL
jgi:hypothetical protein